VASLDEATFLARLARSPRMAALEARVGVAAAEVVEAGARENPALAYQREEVFAAGTSAPEQVVALTWPLDLSGNRGRRVNAASRGVDAARAEVKHARFLLQLEALGIYYDAATARLRVAVLRAGRDQLDQLVATVRARAKAGDASGYDQDRLELELGSFDDALAEAEIDLGAARRAVALAIGEPGGRYDAADPLLLPAAAASAAAPRRDDVAAARLRAEAAQLEHGAGRRSWLGRLSLTGGVKLAEVGDERALGYVVGVALDLPIFDAGSGQRARAAARRREWLAQASALESELGSALPAGTEELGLRVAAARSFAAVQVPRAVDLVRRAEVSYREGERPIFDLIDALRTAREVTLRELALRRRAKQAEIQLWSTRGYR